MSAAATQSLIKSLKRIFEGPEKSRLLGQDYLEEPNSPEYSIFHAIDDSCLLFAIKEDQTDQGVNLDSSGGSSLESTQKLITPMMTANVQDPQSWISEMNSVAMASQLDLRLQQLLAD